MAWTNPRTWTDGELENATILNQHIRDNLLAVGPHLIARKTADESVTSSTTLQNDDHLSLAVGINEVWYFRFGWLVLGISSGGGAGGFKVAFTFPGGTVSAQCPYWNLTLTTYSGQEIMSTTSGATAFVCGTQGTTNPEYIEAFGVYVNGGTAGTFQMQWAQQASSATATTVKTNSTLWAVKLA